MKYAHLWVVLLFAALNWNGVKAEGTKSPDKTIDMDKVIVSFADALTDKQQEIVVAKRISQAELQKLLRPDELDLLPFEALLKQGKGLDFYEVVEQITGSSKFFVYPVSVLYSRVLLPDTGTSAFTPPEQSQWLMILRPNALAAHDGKLRLVEFDDVINGVIAIKDDNRLKVNMAKFVADLKTLKSVSEPLKPDSLLNLQTGLGEVILKQLLATKPITYGSLLEQIVQTKEPTWQLLHKTQTKSGYIYKWKFEEQELVAEVSIEPSEKAASEKFEKMVMSVPVGPRELKDFGDKAYIWKSANRDSGAIMLSKSNVYIHVNGTSLDSATRLARVLVDTVNSK